MLHITQNNPLIYQQSDSALTSVDFFNLIGHMISHNARLRPGTEEVSRSICNIIKVVHPINTG